LSREDLKKRLDELIKTGRGWTSGIVEVSDFDPKARKWATECQIILEKGFGKKSVFLINFNETLKRYPNFPAYQVNEGLPIIELAREELDREGSSEKLEKIKGEIEVEKAEAKRRAAVVETKLWGAVIELIDLQRDQLKAKSRENEQMVVIRKNLEDIKDLIVSLADEVEKLRNKIADSAS
jgi:hypothetical protein